MLPRQFSLKKQRTLHSFFYYVAEMSQFTILFYLITDQKKFTHSHFIPVQKADLQKQL
jgi:hypothetical protein